MREASFTKALTVAFTQETFARIKAITDQKKISMGDAYSADSATRFRRNPPPCSDPSRQGVPIDSATPDRSVATLVF